MVGAIHEERWDGGELGGSWRLRLVTLNLSTLLLGSHCLIPECYVGLVSSIYSNQLYFDQWNWHHAYMLHTGLLLPWLQEPVPALVASVLVVQRKTAVGSYDHRSQVVATLGFCHHQIHSLIAKHCQFEIRIFPSERLTTASTLSSIARLALSMASRVPTRPISRSVSLGPEDGDTFTLHPVVL